jgi:succinate dehydrogenase / fumarate reductase, cytochrome b subunit
MASTPPATRSAAQRPLSPHLQVWRWHVTMATSIFHRASGVALYIGALCLVAWLVALASGPKVFAAYQAAFASPLGALMLFAITAALMFHILSGLRHLVWDFTLGGMKKGAASASSWVLILGAGILTVAIWALFIGSRAL